MKNVRTMVSRGIQKDIVIQFEGVAFSYGSIAVLENVHFHIHRGEFIALVGPNGAGKSTVLKLLLGLEKPNTGRIHVLGMDPEDARARIGYIPQHADLDPSFPISVWEVVRMGRLRGLQRFRPEDKEAIARALAQVEVEDLASRSFSALSGGQRRRVLVARALAAEPEILVMDEPTTNMDAESETRLYKTLGNLKGNTTILIVTHDTEFVSALTDRVLCVGKRSTDGKAHALVQHRTVQVPESPLDLYGGQVAKVLHEETLPEDSCCIEVRSGVEGKV
ncbi:MAG: metal ABC transporter ATP-binding protein [Spirochaetes bacterium]|nr:metal ABC transporter ATP-binding protein [Spirochaetota bacterium]